MLVRPTITAPAAIRRSMTGALRSAGGASFSTTEPAVVTCPATSNKSLTDTGNPSSGERTMPAARSSVAGLGGGAGAFGIDQREHARALARRVLRAGQRGFGQLE
jgi:hypothetical protein